MTSLTAPWDRDPNNAPVQASRGVVLTEEQVQHAVSENSDTGIVDKFPKVDRLYADPIYNNQMYCLHSFVPSKGAKPDDHGVFGFMKCRGSCHTMTEANQRAEDIIRNIDSYHQIQTCYSGRPFPVCADTKKFVQETHEVDIRKKAVETISEDIKQKRREEKQEIDDIKEREQNLLNTTGENYEQEPMEIYITLRVKKANLVFTYKETQKKIVEMRESIKKAHAEITQMESEDTIYREQYREKYMNARKNAHIPETSEDNFMNYMGEDIELDFEL